LRIDHRDPVVVPDVRVNLTLHIFQLVQFLDWLTPVRHVNTSRHSKIYRVEKPESTRSVAQYQRLPVRREAPTLALIVKLTRVSKRLRIVDKTDVVLPRELVNLAIQRGDAFREIRDGHVDFLQDFAAFELDAAEARETF